MQLSRQLCAISDVAVNDAIQSSPSLKTAYRLLPITQTTPEWFAYSIKPSNVTYDIQLEATSFQLVLIYKDGGGPRASALVGIFSLK